MYTFRKLRVWKISFYDIRLPRLYQLLLYCRPRFLKYFQVNSVERVYIGALSKKLPTVIIRYIQIDNNFNPIINIRNCWEIFFHRLSFLHQQQLLSPVCASINVFIRIHLIRSLFRILKKPIVVFFCQPACYLRFLVIPRVFYDN